MRLYVDLKSRSGPLRVPKDYHVMVQAAVYGSMDPSIAAFLHDQGFSRGKRSFKMIVFSRLMGACSLDNATGLLVFPGCVRLVISSPIELVCASLLNTLAKRGTVALSSNTLHVENIATESPRIDCDRARFHTLSPVVAYSTFARPDGTKYTCYFDPREKDFVRLVHDNLRRKFEALHGRSAPGEDFVLHVLGEPRQIVGRFKDTLVKGHSFSMDLQGPKDLLQLALDAGLGSKNAQGWGCLALVQGKTALTEREGC